MLQYIIPSPIFLSFFFPPFQNPITQLYFYQKPFLAETLFFPAPAAAGGLGSLNNLLEPRLITAHNHENKMEGRSKRYKKIDFLGEGQVQ